MYAGRGFAAGGFPYRDAGNGPYSHYVDRASSSCTDASNPYGTAAAPRCTIPALLPAGSVVEIHNGPYAAGLYTGNGTADLPVFIRGAGANAKPILNDNNKAAIAGTYTIVEHIEWVNSRVVLAGNYLVLRNSTVRDGNVGSLVAMAGDYGVVYKCDIHNNGGLDRHGITIGGGTTQNWILDNNVHHNSGDAIQFCHTCIRRGNGPANVYIGRNQLHEDRENAIDIKEALGPVVISENTIHGYKPGATSHGDAIRINDEGRQGEVWILANRIFDSYIAIQPHRSKGITFILGNVIYSIPGMAIGPGAHFVGSNTLYNVGIGIAGGKDVRNNIVVNARTHIAKNVGSCSDNLTYQSGGAASVHGRCTNHLNADPLFNDPRAGDFRIRTRSPARNTGTAASPYQTFHTKYGRSIAVDPEHVARPQNGAWDRGAFEVGSGDGKPSRMPD